MTKRGLVMMRILAHCAHLLHKVFEKLRIFPLARPYLHAKVPGRVSQKLLVLQVSYATHCTGSWSMLLKMSNRFGRSNVHFSQAPPTVLRSDSEVQHSM